MYSSFVLLIPVKILYKEQIYVYEKNTFVNEKKVFIFYSVGIRSVVLCNAVYS